MIDLEKINDVYVFSGVTDFRKGISGLTRLVYESFDEGAINNNLYVFCNKNKTSIKILHFEEISIWLYQKRLNVGKFTYPNIDNNCKITKDELRIIISGLDFIKILENKGAMKTLYYNIFYEN